MTNVLKEHHYFGTNIFNIISGRKTTTLKGRQISGPVEGIFLQGSFIPSSAQAAIRQVQTRPL